MSEAGAPTQWDTAFREGRAHGLAEAQGISYQAAWKQTRATTRNRQGEWVPAIPLPLFAWPHRYRCCGKSFWTMEGYRGHYALAHILDPDPEGPTS